MGEPRENFAVGVNLELLERFSKKNLMLKVSKNIHLFIPFHSKTAYQKRSPRMRDKLTLGRLMKGKFYVICTIILQIVQRK